jgi:VWFA-related protein
MERALSAVLAALTAIGGGASRQQPTPPFTADTSLVLVPVVAVDRRGAIVPGLAIEDFQVLEDGRPVPVETFVPVEAAGKDGAGRFIAVVLDNVGTPATLGARVQRIARAFVDRMGPADVIAVITLDRGRSFTTSNPDEARAAIARFRPAFGDTIRTEAEDASRGLRAINQLSVQMSRARHPRTVLVFIGAAWLFSPKEPTPFEDRGPDLGRDWYEAIRATAHENVSVYAIDPAGLGSDVDDYSRSFAALTGGEAWANTNNYDRVVDRVWRDSGSYYLLGYPAPINDHRIHRIEVKVNRPGVTVHARRAR